jgi:hypothetical protein
MRASNRRHPWAIWRAALLAAMVLVFSGCRPPLPVVQGKVTAVSPDGAAMAVQDERAPEGPAVEVDIRSAEIGAPPAVGDEVRFVFRSEGGRNVALRVMNLTRQRGVEAKGH